MPRESQAEDWGASFRWVIGKIRFIEKLGYKTMVVVLWPNRGGTPGYPQDVGLGRDRVVHSRGVSYGVKLLT